MFDQPQAVKKNKDQEITGMATENYEAQQNVGSHLGPSLGLPVNKKGGPNKENWMCYSYRRFVTNNLHCLQKIILRSKLITTTPSRPMAPLGSTANIVSSMKDSGEASDKIMQVVVMLLLRSYWVNYWACAVPLPLKPLSNHSVDCKRKKYQILEKKRDREATMYSTKFDCSEGPDESTHFTIKRIENAETDELGP